ncbi:hypothetical protein [Chondromyces crocatus]|uniref:hypothetical protein n=1 Tax=Chondromyces crocatus TaxID=52 RepID=UPI0012E32579|nr:hypothetical protein [Chondromyces crocatus]
MGRLGVVLGLVMGLTTSALLVAMGCATGANNAGVGGGPDGLGGGGGAGPTSGPGGGGVGGILFDGGFEETTPPPPPPLYAHDRTSLFRGDPGIDPLTLTYVGLFDCVGGAGQDGSMTDLAVSAEGEIWGISVNHVYRLDVQGSQVRCVQTIPLNNPGNIQFYGLAFAPKGVIDPNREVLVAGNTAGELWSVDSTGSLARRGTFGVVPPNDGRGHTYASNHVGKRWELSGDIAFAENNGNPLGFVTVRDCPNPPSTTGCNTVDTLLEIDMQALATATTGSVIKSTRGQIVKRAGCNDSISGDYGNMYGIGIFADRVYGLSRYPQDQGGNLVDISNTDGSACLIQSFQLAWYGAGISTIVPVQAPQ